MSLGEREHGPSWVGNGMTRGLGEDDYALLRRAIETFLSSVHLRLSPSPFKGLAEVKFQRRVDLVLEISWANNARVGCWVVSPIVDA